MNGLLISVHASAQYDVYDGFNADIFKILHELELSILTQGYITFVAKVHFLVINPHLLSTGTSTQSLYSNKWSGTAFPSTNAGRE